MRKELIVKQQDISHSAPSHLPETQKPPLYGIFRRPGPEEVIWQKHEAVRLNRMLTDAQGPTSNASNSPELTARFEKERAELLKKLQVPDDPSKREEILRAWEQDLIENRYPHWCEIATVNIDQRRWKVKRRKSKRKE